MQLELVDSGQAKCFYCIVQQWFRSDNRDVVQDRFVVGHGQMSAVGLMEVAVAVAALFKEHD